MADFSTLSASTNYLTLLQQISDRDKEVAMALDPANTSATNVPTNAVRYSSANKRWEKWSGSAWGELIAAATDAFNMSVTGLRGGTLYGANVLAAAATLTGGTGSSIDVPVLKQAGSVAWTAATLTNLNQLTNGPGYLTSSALSPYAPLASPTFTGTPAAPTAAADTSTTQLATTQFVLNQGYLKIGAAASTYLPQSGGTLTGALSGTTASFSGAITAAAPAAVSAITGLTTAPIEVPEISLGSGGYAAAIHQRTTITGGYRQHLAFGSYRDGNSWGGGAFLALGGNDSNPTENYLFGYGGGITHSSGKTFIHSANYNSYVPSLTGSGASGTWGINVSGSATSINNTGSVTLASATESNPIWITQPSYTSGQPVKLLNFGWYSDTWSLGNIRSGDTSSLGFGLFLNGSEKFRFTGSALAINGNTALHAGNFNSYSPSLTGSGASGTWGINISGNAATASSASSVSWTNVSGRPTALSSFTNDTGYITGLSWSGVSGKPINNVTVTSSTSTPTGGSSGDLVFQY